MATFTRTIQSNLTNIPSGAIIGLTYNGPDIGHESNYSSLFVSTNATFEHLWAGVVNPPGPPTDFLNNVFVDRISRITSVDGVPSSVTPLKIRLFGHEYTVSGTGVRYRTYTGHIKQDDY